MSTDDHAHGDDEHGHVHVVPVKLFAAVLGALLFLTWFTVFTAGFDLGRAGNIIVAMVIACVKGGLVATFFMHLKYDRPINAIVFVVSLCLVGLFLTLTLLDGSQYQHEVDRDFAREKMEVLRASYGKNYDAEGGGH